MSEFLYTLLVGNPVFLRFLHERRGCLYQCGSLLTLVLPAGGLGTHLIWWPWVQQPALRHRLIAHLWFQQSWLRSVPHAVFCRLLSQFPEADVAFVTKEDTSLCLSEWLPCLPGKHGKCLGTVSSKLHTRLFSFRKHTCSTYVWDRNYFSIRTPLNSPPTLTPLIFLPGAD